MSSTSDPKSLVAHPPGRVLRLLVAEDDNTSRFVISKQIERIGHEVVVVTDGLEAWQALAEGEFDVLITDLHMPGLDGLGLTRNIRESEVASGTRLPIVALSATLERDADKCLAGGMDAFLTKPVRADELRSVLESLVESNGPRHEERENADDSRAPPELPEPSELPASPEPPGTDGRSPVVGEGLPALDPTLLAEVYDGITDEAVACLDGFVESIAPTVARLESALETADFEGVARSAHGVSGAARMAGAIELGAVCAAIEESADGGDLMEARTLLEQVSPALERLETAIAALRVEHQEPRTRT